MPAKKKATAKNKTVAKKKTTATAKKKTTATSKKVSASKTSSKKVSASKASANTAIATKPETDSNGNPSQVVDFTPYRARNNEDYMNEPQKDHFREILLNWKKELMEEVDRTVGHMKDDATNFPDPNDRATQEEEFSLELRTRDRERKLIKKINQALDDIDADEYGFCEACGVEIGVQRLEARPTATMCIDCKTLEEIKEKQTRA